MALKVTVRSPRSSLLTTGMRRDRSVSLMSWAVSCRVRTGDSSRPLTQKATPVTTSSATREASA